MSFRRKPPWIISILVSTFLLGLPAHVASQCNVINTMSYTTFAPNTIAVTKTLSMATPCQATVAMAFNCFPNTAAPFTTNMLYATRTGGSPSPSCAWSCGCGTGPAPHVTTNSSDGLPVELMDFSVEDGGSDSGPDDSGESAQSQAE